MKSSPPSFPVLSVPYSRFFARRARHALTRWLEMRAGERPFRLLTLDNDVIGAKVRAFGAYEPEVLAAMDWIAARGDASVALDIGANIGNHAISLSRTFRRVIAFEPHPVMAPILRANALLNGCRNLQVMECGLHDGAGTGVLRQQVAGNSGTLQLVDRPVGSEDPLNEATVRLDRGDDLLEQLLTQEERIDLVKIDVEGAEEAALRGLARHLKRDQPVVCFEVRTPNEGMKVRALLEGMGYTYFYAICASRMTPSTLPRLVTRAGWKKHYTLTPITDFEERHYAAIFASVRPL